MNIFVRLAGLVGIAIVIMLFAQHDLHAILQSVVAVGWGFVGICLLHLLQTLCSALAWRAAIAVSWQAHPKVFLWSRLIREGVSNLLPVAHIGGEAAGARVITLHGANASLATASVIVDMTMEFLTQLVFTITGICILIGIDGDAKLIRLASIGLGIGILAAVSFILAQRWGLFKLLERILDWLATHANWEALGSLTDLHNKAQQIYRNPKCLSSALGFHLASWLLGTGEIWLGFQCMGVPIALHEALIFESLGQAIRSSAFLVPGAIGIQEGGFVMLGSMFGITPEIALALALVKRMRELVLGLPALFTWHTLEGRGRLFDNTVTVKES